MIIFFVAALTRRFTILPVRPAAAPEKIEGGLVQGMTEDHLAVYKGIPVMVPPVGNL